MLCFRYFCGAALWLALVPFALGQATLDDVVAAIEAQASQLDYYNYYMQETLLAGMFDNDIALPYLEAIRDALTNEPFAVTGAVDVVGHVSIDGDILIDPSSSMQVTGDWIKSTDSAALTDLDEGALDASEASGYMELRTDEDALAAELERQDYAYENLSDLMCDFLTESTENTDRLENKAVLGADAGKHGIEQIKILFQEFLAIEPAERWYPFGYDGIEFTTWNAFVPAIMQLQPMRAEFVYAGQIESICDSIRLLLPFLYWFAGAFSAYRLCSFTYRFVFSPGGA